MQSGRTFRVFVSSTFEDLKAERDRLHEDVFPRLREFCRERGARFQAIDLRWGVSEEASLDQQTMNICLSEIARCLKTTPRPNFIVLLGQRYGWCPPPPQIPADEFEQIVGRVTDRDDRDLLEMWYRRDDNAVPPEYRLQPRERGSDYETYTGWRPVESRLHEILAGAIQGMRLTEERRRPYVASATEQEIAAGALRVSRPAGKVFCFLRKIEGASSENGELRAGVDRYIDADQAPLDTLKAELFKKLPDGVRRYEARWSEEEGRPTTDHLDRLAADVYEALARAIQSELDQPSEIAPTEEEVHIEPDRMLDGEGRAHCEFANRLLHRFVGRTDPLQAIHEYLEGEGRRPLAIVAEGGAGKSALVARALEQAVGERSRARIVYRFIGATPRSTDGRTLLYDLCRELSRRYGADEGKVPSDYRELGPLFGSRLALATAKRPLILFLDALDQLSEAHGARGLAWLPDDLPRHVWLVVSGRRQAETFESLERKRSEQLELGPMSRPDGELLLRLWLADAGRTLQAAQLEEVLGKFESKESDGRPLFLRLAFEEARRWSSYDAPETLEPGIEAIIRENLFRRLADEQHHGAVLVSRALGYLAASRFGLAEDELLDVLSRDADLYASFLRGLYHVPPDLLARARDYRRRRETSRVEGDGKAEPDEARATEEWLALLRSDAAKAAELDRFLKDVLPRRDGPHLPVVLWSRLSFDLEPYLTERPSAAGSLRPSITASSRTRRPGNICETRRVANGTGCWRTTSASGPIPTATGVGAATTRAGWASFRTT